MRPRCLFVCLAVSMVLFGTGAGKKPTRESAPITPVVLDTENTGTPIPSAATPVALVEIHSGSAAVGLIKAQESIGDLSAEFALIVSGAGAEGEDVNAQGKMWLTKGRRYAVHYEQPERQKLVSDGTKRWLYLEKINQVQIQSLPPAGNPAEFFLELGGGLPALIQQCDVKQFAGNKEIPGTKGFELIPKPGTSLGFERAQLWLKGENLLPVRVVVKAARQVRVEFRSVKIHTVEALLRDPAQGIPAAMFNFQPPADAEVIPLF